VLLTGSQQFLAGEGEFSRLIYEFGPVFGIAFLLFRLVIFIMVAVTALFSMRQRPLAWFLIPMLVPTLVMGTIEQPTMQGFMVMTLAFALAALKPSAVPAQPDLSVAAPFRTRALSNRMRI
jgi:hypothetical protein